MMAVQLVKKLDDVSVGIGTGKRVAGPVEAEDKPVGLFGALG